MNKYLIINILTEKIANLEYAQERIYGENKDDKELIKALKGAIELIK